MNFTIYGAEFCPRCTDAYDMLTGAGHDVHKVDMEEYIEPSKDWRDETPRLLDVMADHSARNLELPSIYCEATGEFLDYDKLVTYDD